MDEVIVLQESIVNYANIMTLEVFLFICLLSIALLASACSVVIIMLTITARSLVMKITKEMKEQDNGDAQE